MMSNDNLFLVVVSIFTAALLIGQILRVIKEYLND